MLPLLGLPGRAGLGLLHGGLLLGSSQEESDFAHRRAGPGRPRGKEKEFFLVLFWEKVRNLEMNKKRMWFPHGRLARRCGCSADFVMSFTVFVIGFWHFMALQMAWFAWVFNGCSGAFFRHRGQRPSKVGTVLRVALDHSTRRLAVVFFFFC